MPLSIGGVFCAYKGQYLFGYGLAFAQLHGFFVVIVGIGSR